jgi:hypothetical protein
MVDLVDWPLFGLTVGLLDISNSALLVKCAQLARTTPVGLLLAISRLPQVVDVKWVGLVDTFKKFVKKWRVVQDILLAPAPPVQFR